MSSEPPTLWKRIFGWMRGDPPPLRIPVLSSSEKEPVLLQPEEETWLRGLAIAAAENRRVSDVGGDEFFGHIQALWSRGHERLATEWLEKFISAPATPAETKAPLRLKLTELLEERGEDARAIPHLQELALVEEHSTRANYLLAELHRRRGDEVQALRHYEAVLARDMGYPNVRVRAERLRRARGLATPAAMGETIAGAGALGVAGDARYQLLRELGRGATGVVYMARDFELERDVAVKLLHPHLAAADQAAACSRFFEEARLAASLRHPNIVAVLDLDERARRIVMELAAGGTLRDVLRERGPRSVRRALERHAQILSALAAAHRRGVVHRDVKPGNLMFRRDPDAPGAEIVLGDFGVAHLPNEHGNLGAAAVDSTRNAEAVGTLAYMSPEQRANRGVDPRADLYSSAVVLFEMLTGRPPWPREVLLAGTRKRGDFELPEELLTPLPSELATALAEHLNELGEPTRDARPTTPEAVAQSRKLRDLAIAVAS